MRGVVDCQCKLREHDFAHGAFHHRLFFAKDIVMATECTAYRDTKGGLHATPEKATLADLAGVLRRVGEEGGMTASVAKLLFEKREEIERVFHEHDAMLASQPASSGEVTAKPGSFAAA